MSVAARARRERGVRRWRPDVELWIGSVDDAPVERPDPRLLDTSERNRWHSLPTPIERRGYLVAHCLLRERLGRRLGVAATELTFVRLACPRCHGRNGRPAVDGYGDVHFSLARSGMLIAVAVAAVPVGVDVQAIVGGAQSELATRLLHPQDRDELAAIEDPDQRVRAFTQLWARREAHLKGVGTGIAHGLDEHPAGAGTTPIAPPGWTIEDLNVATGHHAALALRRWL